MTKSRNIRRNWTAEEDRYLLENMGSKTRRELAEELNRSYDAVNGRIGNLTPKHEVGGIWTQERVSYLKENGNIMSAKDIADHLNMKLPTVYKKLRQLGLEYWVATGDRWEDYEVQYLTENHDKRSYYEIGRHLCKTASSVQQKAIGVGLQKSRLYGKWTNEELQILKESIESGKSYDEILSKLDRTRQAIIRKVQDLELIRESDFIHTKLNREKELFIVENANKMTDIELAQILHISDKGVAEARKRNGVFKHGGLQRGESQLQLKVKEFLENKFDFIHNQHFGEFIPDFVNHEFKVVIEVNGDYWHCNPAVYAAPKDDKQIRHIVSDHSKKCFYLSNGYMLVNLWENDLNNNFEYVVSKLSDLLTAVFSGNVDYNERAKSVDSFNWEQ